MVGLSAVHRSEHSASLGREAASDLLQARGPATESFTGTDEAKTVRATIDGRQWLTGLYIEDGLTYWPRCIPHVTFP